MLASSLTGYPDPRSNRSIQTLGRLFRATRRAERNRSSSIPTLWVDGWMLAMDANMAAINLRSLEQLPTQTAGGAMQGTRSKRFARGWARPREAHLADSTQVQTPGPGGVNTDSTSRPLAWTGGLVELCRIRRIARRIAWGARDHEWICVHNVACR